MSIQVSKTNAKGNSGVDHSGPNNKTPGPTKVDPRTVTEFQKDYTFGRGNYGNNAYGGPSSLTPGMTTDGIPNLAQKRDPVLDEIQASGTARNVGTADSTGRTVASEGDNLLRDIAAGGMRGPKSMPSPTHPFMSGAASGPKIPGAVDTSAVENPVRKPNGS